MDAITPVGSQIQVPQANQGLNAYSTLVGIQQQQQSLKNAQAAYGGIAAESQQQQQTAHQRSALAQYFQQNDMQQHVAEDGTIDLNVLSDPKLRQAAGDAFPQVAQSILGVKNSQLEAKTRFANLNDTLRTQFDRSVSALREDPDVKADNQAGRQKVTTAMQQFAQSGGPDAQRIADIYTPMMQHVPQGKMSAALGNLQMQAQSASEQQAQQNPALGTQFDKSGNLIGVAQNRASGALSQAPGQEGVQVGLGPKETPEYLARVTTATTAAGGETSTDNQIFAKTMADGAVAERGKELAQRIQEEAQQVRTGNFTKDFVDRLTVLKQHDPNITARQMLQKDSENLKSLAMQTGSTDAERNQISSGFPSPDSMDPDAIGKSARYWEGSFNQAAARRDNAQAHLDKHGSTAGLTQADAQFMRGASPGKYAPPEPKKTLPSGPKLTAYAQAHFGGDTAKASAFLKSQGYE